MNRQKEFWYRNNSHSNENFKVSKLKGSVLVKNFFRLWVHGLVPVDRISRQGGSGCCVRIKNCRILQNFSRLSLHKEV